MVKKPRVKSNKKTTTRKVSKTKSSKLKTKSKPKRKNPDYKLQSHDDNVKLSDFEFQFTREIYALGDSGYYAYDYEIDNILKYQFGSNSVNSGRTKLISLSNFKKIVKKGLLNFDDNNVIEAFDNTVARIPKNIKFIDIGY